MDTITIFFFIVLAIGIVLLLAFIFGEIRNTKKFREEYNEVDRNILTVRYSYAKPQFIIDVVFMNAEGKYVYKHNAFDYDRFDLINEWLGEIGAEELMCEDYNELVNKIKQ